MLTAPMCRAQLSQAAWQQSPADAHPAPAPKLLPRKLALLLRPGHPHARRRAWRCISWILLVFVGHHAAAEDQHDVSLGSRSTGAENQRALNSNGQVAPLRKLWLNSAFGLASRVGAGSSVETIKYVNHTGSLTFYGSRGSSNNTDPWSSGKALLNLMSYDRDLNFQHGSSRRTLEQHHGFDKLQPTTFQATMNSECQRDLWSSNLTVGLSTKYDSRDHIAKVSTSSYLSFSGEALDKTLTVTRSGVVAICYCAVLTVTNLCAAATNWFYAGRLTVRGPVGGQSWVFPTQIVVKIEVQGWGFSASDKLRIIPATGSCVSSNGNPSGDISFKVGCPAIPNGGCRYATTTETIPLSVQTASASQVYITSITTGVQQSTLSFSASVQHVLEHNDVITLDVDRIQVNGKALSSMSSAEKHEAYRLAAERPFSDDATRKYVAGHRLNQVTDSSTGLVDHQKLAVPVGWPSTGGPAFTFLGSQGHWTRRNKQESSANMKGVTAQAGLKACWGVENSGNTRYYAEAGAITFADPPVMKDARINLCTKMINAVAPMVISFTTGAQRLEYTRSRVATTQLMLRFLDVDGKLQLRKAGDAPPSGSGPEIFSDTEEVLESSKKQMLCGRLFNELWSSDPEGFPMPTGCFYSKKFKDNIETGRPTEVSYREFFITFPSGSGLKQNTIYQLVVNAKATAISSGNVLLEMYTMCTGLVGCDRPYQVFEKGMGQASMATEAEAGYLDPSFGTDGFQLQLGDQTRSVLNLSELNVLQIKLVGGEDTRAITANCLLRVFLWPLTLWSISAGLCSAECIKHSGSDDKKCEGLVGCSPEEVVLGSERRNVVKLQLPTVMDAITGTVMHTIKVTGLQLPAGGYFPSRVGAQLTRPDDTKPSYTTAVGFLMKDAEAGSTTGRLVVAGRSGYGPKPFPHDKLNIFYLRLSFGATLWNVGRANAASFSISLPSGYNCTVPGDGRVNYSEFDIFSIDANSDGYYDNNRGHLSIATQDGSWASSTGGTCTYKLGSYNAIFAGTVFYVKVTVDNPGVAMRKTHANNTWQIRLHSNGVLTTGSAPLYSPPALPFISLAQEKLLGAQSWGGNAAVLSPLAYETLQPTQLRISNTSVAQTGDLRVFFRTTQYVGQQGYVVLDAPDGFDFGASCLAGSLSIDYYAFRGASEAQLKPLRDIGKCDGLRYPSSSQTFNRARIMVNGIIDAGKVYGFKIGVTNPTSYNTQQHLDWYIWTEDSNMYGIEGSTSTIKFNPTQSAFQLNFYHKAFGTYRDKFFDNFNIEVADMTPKSISSADSVVTVWPLVFQAYQLTSLRITAPQGFVWVVASGSFKATMNMTTADFPEAPVVENGNQLVWKKISFQSGQTYGFQAKISVPNASPATSSNAFFVEVGFNNNVISDRLMAAMIPAREVKALTRCIVSFASNLASYTANFLEFQLNIATALHENDGLVIKGDANTAGLTMTCPPLLLSGSTALPSDIKCDTKSDSDGLPKVTLKVAATPMLAGYYAFELATLNPSAQVLTAGNWTFGTYSNVAEYPASPAIDRALVAPGFAINGPMLDAGFVPISLEQRLLTLRNDRPSKGNQLIFRFQLKNAPPNSSSMLKLRGPRGFEFAEDCLSSVETSAQAVFGPNTASTWPAEYVQWPGQAIPTACAGDGRFATLTVPAGLQHEKMYVFRIGVLQNPVATPSWNKWTIAFATESSTPFDGFVIWTFTETEVLAASSAKSPTGGNVAKSKIPVTIHFRPYSRIPSKCSSCSAGGSLRLLAPTGFELVEENGACYQPTLMNKGGNLVFTSADFSCGVRGQTTLALQLLADKAIDAGRDYTLIVHVYNPLSLISAGQWRLESRNASSSQEATALDESAIPGHAINNIVNAWTVSNKFNLTNGKTTINDVEFNMQFPDSLKNGDEVLVEGPKGFNLQGNPDIFECNTFRWNRKPAPLPNSGDPLCVCAESVCTIRFTISEITTPAYPENQNLQFAIATENPARTPFITENFWRVSHHRGATVLSSDICPSWGINSQMEDVQIQLVGVNEGAGMMSDISLALTPVSDADTIVLEVLSPTNFDFGEATVALPYLIDARRAKDYVVINRCSIIAGRRTTIRINSVKLGSGGGQTKFNLYTYSDETLSVKMDEQLEYTAGFRLPGKITVAGKELKNLFKEARTLHPVRSLLQARVAELAKAEFTLLFSQAVPAGQKLRIVCQGEGAYHLKTTPFMIIERGLLESSRQCASPDWSEGGQVQSTVVSAGTFAGITATLMPGRPSSEIAIKADTPYLVAMEVVPNQGTSTWLFETTDGGQYSTNTNDGMTSGFSPVEQMSLQVQVARSPPRAFIVVILNVQPGSAAIKKLMVIAPPHFIFPPKCGDMCTAGQALGFTGRRTAAIASPSGEPLKTFTGLRIEVQTPDKTPDSLAWFVEGHGVTGMTTGWAESGDGFQVVQMANSVVWYPGVAGLTGTEITFRFTLAVDAGSQAQIVVESPSGYALRCTSVGSFKAISLPGAPTCTENPLRLTIDSLLVAGTYAFGAVVDIPLQQPEPNTFNIIVRSNDNKVKDSAYNLPGVEIYPLPLESPTFQWNAVEPGKVSTITIGLIFTGSVDTLKALLIKFPETFEHAVEKPTSVRNHNVRFPVALTHPGGWADYSMKDRIKILLDDSAPSITITADRYSWSFPMLMPSGAPPKENVWFLVLCSSAACQEPRGSGSLVSFPITGFNPAA